MNLIRAYMVVENYHPTLKVAEIYDEDAQFASAMNTLFPDFEYPDFSHLTIKQVLAKYNKVN
jgi:hypothetical protein